MLLFIAFTDTWNGRGKPSRHWTTPSLVEAQNLSDKPNTCVYIGGPLAPLYRVAGDCVGTYCSSYQMVEWGASQLRVQID